MTEAWLKVTIRRLDEAIVVELKSGKNSGRNFKIKGNCTKSKTVTFGSIQTLKQLAEKGGVRAFDLPSGWGRVKQWDGGKFA